MATRPRQDLLNSKRLKELERPEAQVDLAEDLVK
jgi:hypothetical protein